MDFCVRKPGTYMCDLEQDLASPQVKIASVSPSVHWGGYIHWSPMYLPPLTRGLVHHWLPP